jgi:hypothetical protein
MEPIFIAVSQAARIVRADDLESPSQGVGQPSARVQVDAPARAVCCRRPYFDCRQIHGRPPTRQVERIAEHVGHFLDRAGNEPTRNEVIVTSGQST